MREAVSSKEVSIRLVAIPDLKKQTRTTAEGVGEKEKQKKEKKKKNIRKAVASKEVSIRLVAIKAPHLLARVQTRARQQPVARACGYVLHCLLFVFDTAYHSL